MRGILFCVEIKNFRGKVYYPARYRTVFVEKGWFISRIDPRLGTLPIYPVVGFLEKADISSIYNFDAGIMYISQLRQFFEKYSHPTIARTPDPWIQGL